MKKELFKHLHEGPMRAICSQIFELEDVLPEGHPVRKQLYKARCEIGIAQNINRENKDKPQDRWVYQDDV